ncbi:hypothetical protein RhiirC2_802999 [Rhizophagus irregularis]|uniref:Uncharacterized protein n=1 Tax=Rhizophagus irregularis TaxID=588596 RepID=A0A2N1M0V6_9GLOM|nr:hypothetical protein RhiirC2_802999 [Rhizophagus irregularis]
MIEAPIIKEQEALEPISKIILYIITHKMTWDCQTQDITNLQDVCSIKDISFEKAPLGIERWMLSWTENTKKRKKKLRDLDLPGTSDIPSLESSTSLHPISNNPVLSEQNTKIKAPEIDI